MNSHNFDSLGIAEVGIDWFSLLVFELTMESTCCELCFHLKA